MRRPLIAGNWKMNKTISEAVSVVKTLKNLIADVTDIDILICPTFTALYAVNNEIRGSNIKLGAQNIFWESNGAFTGEISPDMIKDTGCSYVLIGHSERRQYFGEINKTVNKKIKAAIAADLIPIMCVGETSKERDENITFKIIEKQIKEGLTDLTTKQALSVVIAYEPVWAIGTGKTATSYQAQEVHAFIRKVYGKMYGSNTCQGVRIIYGGSVDSTNISELMKQPDIDGSLVGRASLEAKSFAKLVEYMRK